MNSKVLNSTSTSFVSGNKSVGGIIGDAQYCVIDTVIFANMIISTSNSAGNIVGTMSDNTTVKNTFFDKQTVRSQSASSADIESKGMLTKELSSIKLNSFTTDGGYPVPSALKSDSVSEKFSSGVGFASMTVRYLSGLNSGTALNYTEIKTEEQINGNQVTVDNSNGLVISLSTDKDYAGTVNPISRFAQPAVTSAVSISYSVSDNTNSASLGDSLIGILLKSKLGEESSSFDLFTRANEQIKTIDGISVTDGGIYVNLALPQGYKFTVTAIDGNGNKLAVNEKANEGYLVKVGTAQAVSLSVSVETDTTAEKWGIRSIWSVIGK